METGYFLFSLDTELAWGYFDKDVERTNLFSPTGSRERESINRILELMAEYGIVGTWALVGHLFYQQCEECKVCPILEWQGKYGSFEEVYQTDKSLWYGIDAIAPLLAQRDKHELAFHGYTHEIFDEASMGREQAQIEIQEWKRASQRENVIPKSVIFPRNRIGHLDLFEQEGFVSYRGEEPASLWSKFGRLYPYLKTVDHITNLSTPPIYSFEDCCEGGLVNLPSSQNFFGFNRRVELTLDAMNLHKIRIRRMVKSIRQAAKTKKIVHIWSHPWEFQTDKDFEKLRLIFESAAIEIEHNRMQSVGMSQLAETIQQAA